MPAEFYLRETRRGPAVYVRISHPNDPTVVADRKARDTDKARFPREWAVYQESLKPKPAPKSKAKKSLKKKAA